MVTRIGTGRRKTRQKFSRHYSEKGKINIRRYFQEFANGDMVGLKIDSSQAKGQFFRRFHGYTGKVTGKQGECYIVSFRDGGKQKSVFAHPTHLVKVQ